MRDFSAALVHGSNETAHAFASLKLYDKFHEKMLNEQVKVSRPLSFAAKFYKRLPRYARSSRSLP